MPNVPKWMADQMELLLPSKFMDIEVGAITTYSTDFKKITFLSDLSKVDAFPGSSINFRVSPTAIRHYTPVDFDKEKGCFDVYFHLHGRGPGSLLADQLQAGDRLKVSVPGGRKLYDQSKQDHFFFGDETSFGLYLSLLREIRKNKGRAFGIFELDEANRYIAEDDDLEVVPKNPDAALAALSRHIADYRAAIFYLTGNAAAAQRFRAELKKSEIPSKQIKLQGYWAEGSVGL